MLSIISLSLVVYSTSEPLTIANETVLFILCTKLIANKMNILSFFFEKYGLNISFPLQKIDSLLTITIKSKY